MNATSGSDEHYIKKADPVTVSDNVTSVTCRKIFTPAGERLELKAPNVSFSIRLDAMELETLTWQNHQIYREFVETAGDQVPDTPNDRLDVIGERDADEDIDFDDALEEIKVTNEFAEAHVRFLPSSNGDRVEIDAPKLGYRTILTPTELESVTWQETGIFTEFLEDPFGPGDH